MNNEKTEHPELRQLMDNLYQAGMSIEQVIEHGFDFAKYLSNDVITMRSDAHPQAAQMVRDIADELEIGRTAQHAIWAKNQSGLGKGHVRLMHDE